ncbi:uncharacterized protein LOC123534039 [Mercenaria mercenaria]|uniref:uncharacterized protein LOC123534039 n=1 Tax=Mercenaria mercenaria TaxID=6596 RepID=UPI00234F146D|nr:uncharacterized protein LOC123534039 [Mercenaria mercenaria]XP_053375005.1 uncharacterized protein LOC123534039 [Mercenaria mercenaria]XP_053375006.1 uncharacterized protein LOC123534039 [Mercenaria mercenaria]
MAEGGDLTSIKDGSDADFECVCTPCGEDNIREESVKYCLECKEHLCTTCARCHSRQKATRSHKLVNKDDAAQDVMFAMTTKCRYHPDRDIEMYCGTHDMVYCLKCIATEHRVCNDVTGIEEIKITSVQQKEVERLQNCTRNIQERLAHTDKNTEKNIHCIQEQRNIILTKVEEVERSLIEHIRKLKNEAIIAVNTDYTSIKEELTSNLTMVANMKKEIEKASSQWRIFISMDAGQQFVQMKLIQQTVSDAEKLVEDSEAKGSKNLCFTESTDLKTSILSATSLGHVNTVTEKERQIAPRIYKVKSKNEINIKMKNDRDTCYIIDVCQLQNGTIILADHSNSKIKRLDMNYNIKDHCDLGDYPTGICCTGQNEVAVKMNNNKVQFISAGSSFSKLREISVKGGWCLGMAYCDGELWMSNGSGVNIYSTSGTLMKTVSQDVNGRKIFKSTTQHMAVCGETVIVTDNSDGAVCLGRDYTVQGKLRDERLVNTVGVSVSNDGTVFLSGYNSRNIVMFDKNGKCLGLLVAEDACLKNPLALHYDNKKNSLIVTCNRSDTITIFDNLSD